jgi:hypothetical protein
LARQILAGLAVRKSEVFATEEGCGGHINVAGTREEEISDSVVPAVSSSYRFPSASNAGSV